MTLGAFVGAIVFDAPILVVAHPTAGDRDAGVGVDGVVADKVDREERRHRAVGVFGQVNQQVSLGGCPLAGEGDEHLAADRLAAKRGVVVLDDLELEPAWLGRAAAVNVFPEQLEHLGPAFLRPVFRRFHRGAVLHGERVGEFVTWHLGLVVVCGGQWGVAHAQSDQGGDAQRKPLGRPKACHARHPSQAAAKKQERSDNLALRFAAHENLKLKTFAFFCRETGYSLDGLRTQTVRLFI